MGLDDIFERYKDLQVSDGHDAVTEPAENAPDVKDPVTTDNDDYGFSAWHVWHAAECYLKGTADYWSMDIGKIRWKDLNKLLEKFITRKIKEGKLHTGRVNIPDIVAETTGPDAHIIGRHTLRLTGYLDIFDSGRWHFNGDVSSFMGFDRYNFNADSTRPFAAEAMTTGMRWLGRQYNSRPFDIGVPGKIQVLLMGSWK